MSDFLEKVESRLGKCRAALEAWRVDVGDGEELYTFGAVQMAAIEALEFARAQYLEDDLAQAIWVLLQATNPEQEDHALATLVTRAREALAQVGQRGGHQR